MGAQPMTCPTCGKAGVFGRYCRFCGAPLPLQSEATPKKPRRFWRRLVRGAFGLIFLVMTLIVVLIVAASIWDPIALPLSVIAAVAPAIFYSNLVLRLDKYETEPRQVVIGAFAWGAVGAVFFSLIIELISGALLITTVGEDAGTILTLGVGAPIIEETCKGLALLGLLFFYRDELDNVLDGLVYGALIGLGFAMTENMLYFGAAYIEDGLSAFGVLFIVRAVIDGFGHALYTGTFGAAIGWSRTRYRQGKMRIVVPVIGWCLAVFQHFLWNTGLIVLASIEGEDVSALKVALIEAPLFIIPALVVLFLIARVSSRRELEILQTQLSSEVASGVLTPEEYATLIDGSRRSRALSQARRHSRYLDDLQQRFFQVAAELAFRKYHLSRGERPKPGQRAPEDAYREELAVLRRKLNGLQLP
jgi:RsiW-degrading membrane proteinase PrsW (M82 family)